MSDSAKFRIMSRKDGIEPVVMALMRGIVTVGAVAWAVKGIAEPLRIKLTGSQPHPRGRAAVTNLCVNKKPES